MTKYMEYKEIVVPKDILGKLEELVQKSDPDHPPTLGEAGFFNWLNKLSKDEGWNPVWQSFHTFPHITLEREVVE